MTNWSDEHGIRLDARLRYRAELIDWRTLDAIPTLHEGYTADLKIEAEGQRVWLERVTTADGEHCDHHITVEVLVNGSWIESSTN